MNCDFPMPPSSSSSEPTAQERAQAWSSYWAGDVQHSLAGSFAGNYTGAIAHFWESVFAALPDQARVLDACCGNSPIGHLLMTSAFGARVAHLAAVDAAKVAPGWPGEMSPEHAAHVTVHAEVDVAALPFPEASFDVFISQYGIEYVGMPALIECGRVLRPGGQLAAVLHHVDALPVRIGREESVHLETLLARDGFLSCARAMVEPLARAATQAGRAELMSDMRANAVRSAFNDSLRLLQKNIDTSRYPDVLLEQRAAVMQLLSRIPQIGAQAGHEQLDVLLQALRDAHVRQRELVDHALDEQGVRALLEHFPGEVRQLESLSFDNGEIAGWALVAVRN